MLLPKRPYLPAPQVEVGTANGMLLLRGRIVRGESVVSRRECVGGFGGRTGAQLRLQPGECVVDAVELAIQHGDIFHRVLLLFIQQLLRLILVALKVALAKPVPVPRLAREAQKSARRRARYRREGHA